MHTQLTTLKQKKVQKLFEKHVLKVVTPNKIIMSKEILSKAKIFNSHFVKEIKDLYIDKIYKKSQLVI